MCREGKLTAESNGTISVGGVLCSNMPKVDGMFMAFSHRDPKRGTGDAFLTGIVLVAPEVVEMLMGIGGKNPEGKFIQKFVSYVEDSPRLVGFTYEGAIDGTDDVRERLRANGIMVDPPRKVGEDEIIPRGGFRGGYRGRGCGGFHGHGRRVVEGKVRGRRVGEGEGSVEGSGEGSGEGEVIPRGGFRRGRRGGKGSVLGGSTPTA